MSETNPLLNISDPLDRQALWAVHDKRCRYCRAPLSFSEIEIEHIIPIHLKGKPAELTACLQSLALSGDYDLNSVDNLLPAHGHCNREKRGAIRDESFLRHFREIAKSVIPNFNILRDRMERQRRAEPDVAALAQHISAGSVTLQDVVNATTQIRPFDSKEDILKPDFVRIHQSSVRIDCHLPTEAKPAGTAIVTFHSVNIRGIQVELGHDVLSREMFRGVGAPLDPRWRRFLTQSSSEDAFYFKVRSSTVRLEHQEAADLCFLIDRLCPIYLAAIRRTEEAFSGIHAPMISPGVYEIASVPLGVWQHLSEFIRLHDLANGDSDWHIFDAPAWVSLKIIKRKPQQWEYRCILEVAMKRPDGDPRLLPYKSVSLRWHWSNNHPLQEGASLGWRWDVQECVEFIHSCLLPKALSFNWLSSPILAQPEGKFSIRKPAVHRELTSADFTSPEKALNAFEEMQHLYLREHNDYVQPHLISSAYNFLDFLLQTNQLPPWSLEYIGEKLACKGDRTLSEIVMKIRKALQIFKNHQAPNCLALSCGDTLDHVLRSVMEVLRNGQPQTSMREGWPSWFQTFDSLTSDFNHRNYLVRLQCEDFDEATAI